MNIDVPTLGYVICLVGFLMVVVLLMQNISGKTYPGIGWWVIGVVSITAGLFSMMLRVVMDCPLVTVMLGNFLIVTGNALIYNGMLVFFRKKGVKWLIPLVLVLFLIAFSWVTFRQDSIDTRTVIVGLAISIFSFLAAFTLFTSHPRSLRYSANFCGSVLAAFGLSYLVRAADALFFTEVTGLFDQNWFQLYGFLSILITMTLLTFGMVFMLNQRLRADIADARENFAASELQYQTFMNSTPDIVYLKDDQFRYRMINQAQADFFGLTKSELLGKTDSDLMPPEMAENCHRTDREVMASGETRINLETVGNLIYETRKFPVQLTNGRVGVGAFIRDVTEARRAGEALLKEQSLMQAIMDYLPHHIFFKDRESRFIRINRAHAELFGLSSPDEAVGKTDFDFFSEKHARKAYEDEQLIMQTGIPLVQEEIESWERRPDSWVTTVKMPLLNSSGTIIGTFGISMDIDERRRQEEEIALKNQQLEQAVAEKDRLFSIIAHDLRSPFNAILGLTELMADEQEEFSPAQMRKSAKIVWNSARSLNDQLGNLLEWSRIQMNVISIDPSPLNLRQEVATELALFAGVAQHKQIRLTNIVPESLMALTDRQMLYSILRNLITNAIKFTNPGGQVTVFARLEPDGHLIVSIRDSGIGMSPEILARLFDLTGQAYRRGTGGEPSSGLGLVICRQLVEKLGGRIWAESVENKGTTFHFSLPVYTQVTN